MVLGRNRRARVVVDDPRSGEERTSVARACAVRMRIAIPVLVDGVDNAVASAYGGWPDRLYLIGRDGRVAFQGGGGPFGFKPGDLKEAIGAARLLASSGVETNGKHRSLWLREVLPDAVIQPPLTPPLGPTWRSSAAGTWDFGRRSGSSSTIPAARWCWSSRICAAVAHGSQRRDGPHLAAEAREPREAVRRGGGRPPRSRLGGGDRRNGGRSASAAAMTATSVEVAFCGPRPRPPDRRVGPGRRVVRAPRGRAFPAARPGGGGAAERLAGTSRRPSFSRSRRRCSRRRSRSDCGAWRSNSASGSTSAPALCASRASGRSRSAPTAGTGGRQADRGNERLGRGAAGAAPGARRRLRATSSRPRQSPIGWRRSAGVAARASPTPR